MCLTNLGDVLVLSIPELKRQINAAAVRREDINGISSLCFTNYGEALYMMSSSELQRISLSATRGIRAEGHIDVEEVAEPSIDEKEEDDDDNDNEDEQKSETGSINTANEEATVIANNRENLTNGVDVSPNKANVTITSSIGDITVDSVRDHLNATVTTLHTTTTEEIVGRLSVLSTQTNNTTSSIAMKDISDINLPNFKDLSPIGDTTETSTSTVVIKSVITSISNGQENGESETIKNTTTTTRKESQL